MVSSATGPPGAAARNARTASVLATAASGPCPSPSASSSVSTPSSSRIAYASPHTSWPVIGRVIPTADGTAGGAPRDGSAANVAVSTASPSRGASLILAPV